MLQDKLHDCCDDLGLAGLHQVLLDGPNVNRKAVDLMNSRIERETKRKLLDVGSCGLHILHNAFRRGMNHETGWHVEHTLTSLHWLFKDAPARREDFMSVTGSMLFPLKFCSHCWLENVPVAERALEI